VNEEQFKPAMPSTAPPVYKRKPTRNVPAGQVADWFGVCAVGLVAGVVASL
jgi:hypothetical protein